MIIENNEALYELLKKKKALVEEMSAYSKDAQKKLEDMSTEVQSIKEDIMLMAHDVVTEELEDNQSAGTIKLNDKDEIEVEVFDVVEEAIKANKEQKQTLHNQMVKLRREKKKGAKKKEKADKK